MDKNIYIEPDNMKTIYQALLKAQSEFPSVKKESTNPFFKNKYAGLESVLEVVLPILHENGLFIVQSPISEGDRVGVQTSIFSENGEEIKSSFTMALSKNDPQGAGSAITYAKRYALIGMLGLNLESDDDANAGSGLSEPVIRR